MLIILRLCWEFVCTFGLPILIEKLSARITLQISSVLDKIFKWSFTKSVYQKDDCAVMA